MLAFTSPASQASLVVRSGRYIPPGERMALGRTASHILPRLYLANLFTAQSVEQLTELGITHVVSVMDGDVKLPKSMPHLRTLQIPVEDAVGADLLQYLDQTTAFIKAALLEDEDNRVLVHCIVGMSRSATVVCAYLIATRSMTPDEAISFVVEKRRIVAPNEGFRRQLEKYYTQLHPKALRPTRGFIQRLRLWKGTSQTADVASQTPLQAERHQHEAEVVVDVSAS